jgi:beta-xylosidase
VSDDVFLVGTGEGRRRIPRLVVLGVAAAVVTAVAIAAGVHTPVTSDPPPAVPPGLAAADRPPVDPNPSAPGVAVGSGQDQSDPFLTIADGRYFLYTSGVPGTPPVNVPVASATDFGAWSPITDALPVLPRWAVPGYTWAPDVRRFGSTYVLYFTAMLFGSRPAMECIGDATGSAPDGPFTPARAPFICQVGLGGSIDPRVFTDANGSNWMLWKSDQNIGGAATPTQMWSQELTSDGLGLIGQAAVIMTPDEGWQGTIVEAPDMVEINGSYWDFYSGNWFNQPAYAIGAARCAGPEGPCSDSSPLPLLGSNDQGQGPGEESVFEDPSGIWMLYSPWRSQAPHPDFPLRPVFITRIGLTTGGPYLAAGGPPPSLDALGPLLPAP